MSKATRIKRLASPRDLPARIHGSWDGIPLQEFGRTLSHGLGFGRIWIESEGSALARHHNSLSFDPEQTFDHVDG